MEKATPALNVPVGDSVAGVLGLDAVVLGDGGVLSGAVGRYVFVGERVSAGVGRVCCVDTMAWVLSAGVCVTLTGCQEVVTRRCVERPAPVRGVAASGDVK